MREYLPLLKWIWLNEKWSLIYLSLLEHWTSSISDIVTNTSIHRVEIYRLLPFLLETWLILSSPKWKRTFYKAASPALIEDEYKKIEKQNKASIERLIEKFSFADKKPNVIYWEWKKAVTYIFNDIVNSLKKWDIFYRISSETNVDHANSFLPSDYRTKRDKKELERYVIMSSKWAKAKNPRLERDLVVIPEDIDEFDENISMTIYWNKIAYIDFSHEVSIIIESPEIVKFQTKLFKILFRSLKN